MNLDDLERELALMIKRVSFAQALALRRISKIVEKEAKSYFGEYQNAAGEFEAWRELSSYTKKDRVKKGYTENDPLLRSGKLRSEVESRSDFEEARVGSDDPIMEYQELGTEKIPPRSVLGGALVRKEKEVVLVAGKTFYDRLFKFR